MIKHSYYFSLKSFIIPFIESVLASSRFVAKISYQPTSVKYTTLGHLTGLAIITNLLFNLGNYFFTQNFRKNLVLQIFTSKSHMRFCSAFPMLGIGVVQHSLCQEQVLSNITNAMNRFGPI